MRRSLLRSPQRVRRVLRHGVPAYGRRPASCAFTIVSLLPGIPALLSRPYHLKARACANGQHRARRRPRARRKVRLRPSRRRRRRRHRSVSRLPEPLGRSPQWLTTSDPRDPHDQVRQAPRPRHRDLGGQATGAPTDGGVSIATGNPRPKPDGGGLGIAEAIQKQIGQTGIPGTMSARPTGRPPATDHGGQGGRGTTASRSVSKARRRWPAGGAARTPRSGPRSLRRGRRWPDHTEPACSSDRQGVRPHGARRRLRAFARSRKTRH